MMSSLPASNAEPARRTRTAPTPVRLLVVAIGGFLYGSVTVRLPAPRTDATIFWIGNLAAPYVLIPFLAGAWRFRAAMASAAGALGAAAAVAGFYNIQMVGDVTNADMGLSVHVTARSVVLRAYGDWFRNLLLGDPGGRPWLAVAIIAGLVFGYLGYLWHTRRSRAAGTVVALAFIVEPLVQLSGAGGGFTGRHTLHASNIVIWSVEALIGIAGLVWVWRPALSGRSRPETAPSRLSPR